MPGYDVGFIVPSLRDLHGAIATKKRGLALVCRIDAAASAEAARLDAIDVPAFALDEAGAPMTAAAIATKSVPVLCLSPLSSVDAVLEARFYGADGVCIDAALAPDAFEAAMKQARSTRMAALAFARDAAEAQRAVAAGVRGVVVRAKDAAAAIAAAAGVERMALVALVPGADVAALRALAGHFDAAIAEPAVHGAPGFADLAAELNP